MLLSKYLMPKQLSTFANEYKEESRGRRGPWRTFRTNRRTIDNDNPLC